ncbi:MAG: VWA domain-containing protein [Verrucomicrobia bacterium]|nr:VWA domain-containing protein [Verrucomicrobiota bacterium]
MSFLAPAAFLFAAAIPVVIVFYLLKRKRVVKLVSSTVLWHRFLADNQANAPFQKLRKNWLLFLQILLLALVVLALSRPFFKANARESRLRVVILDGSASMQATDERPSRFEVARAEALKWVDGMGRGEQMMVLLAGGTTEVKQSPTTDKAALRRALQSSAPSDAPTRLADALRTAGAFTFEKRGEEEVSTGEIHLFSDGAVPELTDFENKNLPLVYHRIGQRGNNLGIVTLDVRANPEDPSQRAVFTSVANYSTNAQQADLELRFEDQLLETRPLTLKPRETAPQVFVVAQPHDGVFHLRLTAKDDLEADNQAAIVSLLPLPAKVLLVSRGNRFLEKALRAAGNVELSVTTDSTDEAKGFDLAVLDDVTPTVWPKANLLAIHVAQTNWFDSVAQVQAPAIVDWKNTHPLLRWVTFDNVQIADTMAVKTPTWAVPLAESPQTPLLLLGELGGQRIVWVGFDTLQSTWPLRISFPIFIANAVEWLNPASANVRQLLVRAGDPFRLALGQAVTKTEVKLPDGTTKPLPLDPGAHEIVFGDTTKQGTYRLAAGTNEVPFCVNLLDATESDTTPRAELKLGKYAATKATTLKRANLELWRWIAAAGLCVLMFEWWYYHRRTA